MYTYFQFRMQFWPISDQKKSYCFPTFTLFWYCNSRCLILVHIHVFYICVHNKLEWEYFNECTCVCLRILIPILIHQYSAISSIFDSHYMTISNKNLYNSLLIIYPLSYEQGEIAAISMMVSITSIFSILILSFIRINHSS